MKSTVSTKFNIPKLDAKLVVRPRIMQLFGQGLDRRLTLVSAPAGYGKTTSVVAWLRSLTSSEIKAAWYALDAEDNEFTTFFTRFVAALYKAPQEVREFMLKTSLVARFNVDLAVVMTELGAGACGRILDQVRRANLFLVPLDGTAGASPSRCPTRRSLGA